MSEGQNYEPNLPPLGLKQQAAKETLSEETTALDVAKGKSLGALIRDARTAKGLSAADLAQSLNLDLKIVERLESNQFEGGPDPIYVRAYLKHWAALLGVDPQVWLQAYQLQHGGDVSPNKIGVTAPIEVMTAHKTGRPVHSGKPNKMGRSIGRLLLTLISLAVLLAVIAVALPGIWQKGVGLLAGKQGETTLTLNGGESGHTVSLPIQTLPVAAPPAESPKTTTATINNDAPPPPPLTGTNSPETATSDKTASTVSSAVAPAVTSHPAATEAAATPTEQATPVSSTNLVIKVNSADCWVEVRNAEGKRLVYDVIKKGDERTVAGSGPFTVTLGNPSVVTVLWKGEPVKLGAANSTTGIVRTTVGGS
jgi:cytoskeleton protein RodZ